MAIGSSGMAEGMSDSSKQKVLMVKLGEQMEAGNVVLTDSEGNVIVSYTALKTYDCVIISTAEVESGATYNIGNDDRSDRRIKTAEGRNRYHCEINERHGILYEVIACRR